jgi:hypothetical protein
MTLQLEYSCTEAELKEAQSLHLLQRYGGGSKWRARLAQFGILVAVIAVICFRFTTEIERKDRLWFVALAVVIYIALLAFKRKTKRKPDQIVRLEVSEHEVVFNNGNARTSMPWSAFSQCLESPNLFALLDRRKAILYAVPKRAFADEATQNWFRTQANQPHSVAAAAMDETFVPGRFVAANGIALSLELKYKDYLSRNITSWRMKGIALAIFAFVIGSNLYMAVYPPPDAVNSPLKVFLITLPILAVMMVVVISVVSFVFWRAERKFLSPQQIVLTSEGIEFVSRDSSGRLPWSTYKYYLENHWSFFVWHPSGSLWFMFPKREFASPSDLEQFRALLQTNLKASRWFYL